MAKSEIPVNATVTVEADAISDADTLHTFHADDGRTAVEVIPLPPGWTVHEIHPEAWDAAPHHKQGLPAFDEADSFLSYIALQDETPTVYCNRAVRLFVAVFDDDTGSTPGWRRHRATLELAVSDDWRALLNASDRSMTASAMADWLEDQMHLIAEPGWSDLATLVRKFRATTKLDFSQELEDDNGDVSLQFTRKTSVGGKESMTPPETITFVCPVIQGGDPVQVEARFRYRAPQREDQALSFSFKLIQPDKAVRDAFDAIAGHLGGELERPVLFGTPATERYPGS